MFLRRTEFVAGLIAGAGILAMMVYIVLGVSSRYLLGIPFPAVTEIAASWLMGPSVLAGWLIAQATYEQITVDLLSGRLRGSISRVSFVVSQLISAVFVAVVGWYGYIGARTRMERGEFGVDTGWPIWVTRFIVPTVCLMMLLVMAKQVQMRLAEDI